MRPTHPLRDAPQYPFLFVADPFKKTEKSPIAAYMQDGTLAPEYVAPPKPEPPLWDNWMGTFQPRVQFSVDYTGQGFFAGDYNA